MATIKIPNLRSSELPHQTTL